jgi:hypothetical protein
LKHVIFFKLARRASGCPFFRRPGGVVPEEGVEPTRY